MNSRNIVIFSQSIQDGGAERQAIYLARALEQHYNVFFVTYYKHTHHSIKNLAMLESLNIQYIELKGTLFRKLIIFYSLLKRNNIEIIFSYLLLPNFIGGLIGMIAGIKYPIGGIRGYISKNKVWLNKILQNRVNKFTIYNNHSGLHKLNQEGFKASKSLVIENCIAIKERLLERSNCEIIGILSVGRFVEEKDYFTALRSIKSLKLRNIKFKYTIIGYGRLLENIKKCIEDFDLRDCVELVINPIDIDKYYQINDIFLMTSIFEGLSNSALEAMSFSLPLVLTNAGDNYKLVENGNGFLCKVGDFNEISEKLENLISNQDLRSQFGKRSYELVKSNYSFEAFQNKYLTFIRSLR